MSENNDDLIDNFDQIFENETTEDTTNSTETTNVENVDDSTKEENIETLEDLIKEDETKANEKIDKSDNNVNGNKQITEQQSNKSKGNNNSQDLLDNNGNIIAKAGAERRFYEENVKLKRERDNFNANVLPKIKQEYDAMVQKIDAYNETFKSMQMGDLSTEDISLGLELIRQWKKSPKDTINFLLTQAKSYGIDIDEDGKSTMAAFNQMLDQKLQPLLKEREMQENYYKSQRKAENIYNNFITKYPDASIHTDELAYMFNKDPSQSLDALYYQLKNYYLKNGYDFNTPLAEIQKQKQQQRNTFNGINVNQNIKTANIQTPIARANDSFDNIIRDAMKSVKK